MANGRKQRRHKSKRNIGAKRQRSEIDDNDKMSSIKIVDVNNDCLEHVFNYLDLMDLINVASANKHLGQAAAKVYGRKYKGRWVQIGGPSYRGPSDRTPDFQIFNDFILIYKPASAFKILRLFGDFITRVAIGESNETVNLRDKIKFLIYVNEFCSETLKSFKLDINGLAFSYAETMKPYKNVEEVTILKHGCEESIFGFEASQFNDVFPKMRRLELRDIGLPVHKRFAFNFHHLEHLYIDSIEDLKELIRLNPQLQSLGTNTSNLEFWDYANKQLKHLKVLDLCWMQMHTANPILFENVEILTLNMRFKPARNPERVLLFKKLKECTIWSRLDKRCINFIIGNPTIEKLHIKNSIIDDQRPSIKSMVKIAEKLPKLIELNITDCSVKVAIRFLNKSQTVRKFTMGNPLCWNYYEHELNELCSGVAPEWNMTSKRTVVVIERK